MKICSFIFLMLCGSLVAEAQISLTLLSDHQLTPNAQDTSGVFCRTFYHEARNKFYVVYASRALLSPPGFNQYYRWEEYDTHFAPTGTRGVLQGVGNGAGDYAMTMVGKYYYHLTGTGMAAWQYRLTKFDEDFNVVNSITFAIDSSDSKADMMLNYANGKLIVGAFHQNGVLHPTMPVQSPLWTPQMHKWEFDTSLAPIGSAVYLNEIFTTWGSSCLFNNNQYHVVSFDKWKGHFSGVFNLSAYRYDSNWHYIDSVALHNDGQWSQGLLWDGNYYYVAYHTGHIHRGGNVTVSVYDIQWSPVHTLQITNNQIFDTINQQPTINAVEFNANRPFLTKVNDTLYVSYDQDDYICTDYTPVPQYHEGKRWQAHVAKLKINGATGLAETKPELQWRIDPNPAKGNILVQSSDNGVLELFDLSGRLVFTAKIKKGKSVLTIDHLSSGHYIANLQTDQTHLSQKIFVQ